MTLLHTLSLFCLTMLQAPGFLHRAARRDKRQMQMASTHTQQHTGVYASICISRHGNHILTVSTIPASGGSIPRSRRQKYHISAVYVASLVLLVPCSLKLQALVRQRVLAVERRGTDIARKGNDVCYKLYILDLAY